MWLNKVFIIAAFVACCICLHSCKEKKQQQQLYFLKGKWTTKTLRYTFLRNSPRSVTELVYPAVNDIESNSLPIFASAESFSYNPKGDEVEYEFSERGEKYNTVTRYSDSGYSVVEQDHSGRNLEERLKTDFQQVEKNKFRQTDWLLTLGRKTQWVTYSNNGDTVTKEEIRADTPDGKGLQTKMTFIVTYDDQRPLTQTWIMNSAGKEVKTYHTFFYSPKKHLDSIVSENEGRKGKTCFVNNNMGDPTEEYSVENGDTTYHFVRTYKYDKSGNWVRMLERRLPDKYWPTPGVREKDPYTLYTRKIFYLNKPNDF